MIKKNVTKHALILSIISMLLCCSMFMGTTYAWFTDSVTSDNNIISSGTLDVDFLKYNTETQVYESIANKEGAIFTEKNGMNWEPGKTEVVHFLVQNNGTLYLKYNFFLSVLNQGLIGALEYAVVEGNYTTVSTLDSWDKIVAHVGTENVKTLAEGKYALYPESDLAPKDDANGNDKRYFALAVHMGESVSNDYQGKSISIDASIFATQASKEGDSFGTSYDADATYNYVNYDDNVDFTTLWNEVQEGNTINLQKDLTVAGLTVDKNLTIDAAGKAMTITDGITFAADKTLTIKNAKMNSLSVSGNGTLGLSSVTINNVGDGVAPISDAETQTHALHINNANLKLIVKGYTVITGGMSGDGIHVGPGSTLDLSGTGKLVAVGNAGVEDKASTSEGGSGIGCEGAINIHEMANLTAEGYGKNGFGIGGNGVNVSIEKTNIAYVKGGFVQSGFVSDTKYGKTELEGGAAIGGATITLKNVTVEKAEGGSKAAGIGAQFHQAVTIDIADSTIKSVIGGNASAGIGGSRMAAGNQGTQTVNITITNSTINAVGGEYGAGIGSGYDTYCAHPSPICTINIKGTSKINATGGKYAAGIGTGFHAGGLAGGIESTVEVTAVSGEKFYKNEYTQAQDIGFGVVDPAREGQTAVGCTFDNKGVEVKVVNP